MNWRLDHAVISVRDLDEAVEDYRTLGFTVMLGGVHPGGWTHNALILLADGTYLELLAPVEPRFLDDEDALAAPNFLFALVDGEGAVGLALTTDDLTSAVTAMRQRSVNVADPRIGGRMRPDGVRLEWRSAMLGRTVLPFFIEDITPREWRVPANATNTTHANGVTGLSNIRLRASQPGAVRARVANLLGEPGTEAGWALGTTRLRVEQADDQGVLPELALTLTAAKVEPRRLNRALAHGAELRLGA
jgi:catechol 2,3-dioxygenase-like lactoylglutathione lyase family enzyme